MAPKQTLLGLHMYWNMKSFFENTIYSLHCLVKSTNQTKTQGKQRIHKTTKEKTSQLLNRLSFASIIISSCNDEAAPVGRIFWNANASLPYGSLLKPPLTPTNFTHSYRMKSFPIWTEQIDFILIFPFIKYINHIFIGPESDHYHVIPVWFGADSAAEVWS